MPKTLQFNSRPGKLLSFTFVVFGIILFPHLSLAMASNPYQDAGTYGGYAYLYTNDVTNNTTTITFSTALFSSNLTVSNNQGILASGSVNISQDLVYNATPCLFNICTISNIGGGGEPNLYEGDAGGILAFSTTTTDFTNHAPIISFVFPSSTAYTAPFTAFQLNIQDNIDSPDPSVVDVYMQAVTDSTSSAYENVLANCNTGSSYTLASKGQGGQTQNNLSDVIQYVPTQPLIFATATTTQWYACAAIIPQAGAFVPNSTSSVITFFINNQSSTINNNYTYGVNNTVESTSSAYCVPPNSAGFWDVSQWGPGISYGLCSVASVYFGNAVPGYQFMLTQWTAFQNTPPFNLVFGIASSTASAVNASGTQQTLAIGFAIGTDQESVNVLSSSTLTQLFVTAGNGHNIAPCDQSCAQGKVNTIMDDLSTMIYAGTGITTIAMIL